MEIIIADDEKIILDALVETVQDIQPQATIHAFSKPTPLLEFIDNHSCDIAFLDIEMGKVNGLEIAKQIKIKYPKVNIIFVTGYNNYAIEAFKIKASGYVLKPFTKEDIEKEFNDLRTLVPFTYKNKLTVRCFGQFEVYYDNKPLKFERNKTKELLAYLIDKQGKTISTSE